MNAQLADVAMGRNRHIYTLLNYMARETVEFPEGKHGFISTDPFLNCREQGFVISVMVGSQTLHLAFFEHRNSDELCALKWKGGGHIAGGWRPGDIPEGVFPDKWTHAATWPYMSIVDATEWAMRQIETFIENPHATV